MTATNLFIGSDIMQQECKQDGNIRIGPEVGFNGGKALHPFDTEGLGGKKGRIRYVADFNSTDFKPPYPPNDDETERLRYESSDRARDAFERGVPYLKIDGSCHRLVWDGECFQIYARLDGRKRKYDIDNLPDGIIALQAGNPWEYQSHKYYFEHKPRGMLDKKGRISKMGAVYDKMYADLAKPVNHKKLMELVDSGMTQISFEAVGRKFNQTHGVDADGAIAIHRFQVCTTPFVRTFEGVRKFLQTINQEGIILVYNGRAWKIRSDAFEGYQKRTFDPPVCLV